MISDHFRRGSRQVDPPDVQGRYEILKVHAKGKNLAPGVDLLAVARQTPGMSGAGRSRESGIGLDMEGLLCDVLRLRSLEEVNQHEST